MYQMYLCVDIPILKFEQKPEIRMRALSLLSDW